MPRYPCLWLRILSNRVVRRLWPAPGRNFIYVYTLYPNLLSFHTCASTPKYFYTVLRKFSAILPSSSTIFPFRERLIMPSLSPGSTSCRRILPFWKYGCMVDPFFRDDNRGLIFSCLFSFLPILVHAPRFLFRAFPPEFAAVSIVLIIFLAFPLPRGSHFLPFSVLRGSKKSFAPSLLFLLSLASFAFGGASLVMFAFFEVLSFVFGTVMQNPNGSGHVFDSLVHIVCVLYEFEKFYYFAPEEVERLFVGIRILFLCLVLGEV